MNLNSSGTQIENITQIYDIHLSLSLPSFEDDLSTPRSIPCNSPPIASAVPTTPYSCFLLHSGLDLGSPNMHASFNVCMHDMYIHAPRSPYPPFNTASTPNKMTRGKGSNEPV